MSEVDVPPGTPIFGMIYSDASAGGWDGDRDLVLVKIANAREIGLRPVGLARVRMKRETLVWDKPDGL